MRLLILSDRIPPENVGGAEKVTWALARGLRDTGHEVHAIAATTGAPFKEVRDGIPTYHLHVQYPARWWAYLSLYNPQVVAPLKTLYERIQPDVISAFNIHHDLTYYSLTLADRMGFPVVLSSQDVMAFAYNKLTHFIDPAVCGVRSEAEYRLPRFYNLRQMRLRYNPLRNVIIRSILQNNVQARTAASEAHRQSLHANGLSGFQVVHASVTPEDFAVSADAVELLRAKLGAARRKVILFAGRLTPDKGSYQLLDALNRLIEAVPEALLLTLSRASLESQGLNEPAYRHLKDKHVIAGGWMQGEELAAAYQLADVVVVPSICMDCFPTINLEAMAAAKPVIATCYGGSPEAVVGGETGFIVNPFDTVMFADRLRLLLTDEGRAQEMGAAGYQRLQQHFTRERHVRQMEAIYQDVIASHARKHL